MRATSSMIVPAGIDSLKSTRSEQTVTRGLRQKRVAAIKAASFILIPVQPSPYDIWATSDLVDLVKQRMELVESKLKAAFVVSRAIKGTKISGEISEALKGYQLPILNTVITQRVIYPSSAASGTTVLDVDINSEAAKEINCLMEEINKNYLYE